MDHAEPHAHTPGILIQHAGGYEFFTSLVFGGRRRRVYKRLAWLSGASAGDRVLDVGCGTGYFTKILADLVGPDGRALGVDASSNMLERARRAAPGCSFREGIAEALDDPDASYDVVVSSLMIHHLPDELRPQAIAEMFRVLRPAGRVLVADFRPPTGRLGRALMGSHLSPAMRDNPVHLLDPLVRAAGFERVDGGHVRPWMTYVRGTKPSTTGE